MVNGVIVCPLALECVYPIANSFELSKYPIATLEPGRVIIKPRSKDASPLTLSLPISMMASLMVVLFECKVVTRPLKVASPSTTKFFCIYVFPKTESTFDALIFTWNLEPADIVFVGELFAIPITPAVTKLVGLAVTVVPNASVYESNRIVYGVVFPFFVAPARLKFRISLAIAFESVISLVTLLYDKTITFAAPPGV